HPQPALFDLAPAAARVPLLENLAGEFEPRVRTRPKLFLQRWRCLDFSGHQHDRAQSHRFAKQAVREKALRQRAAGAALGPADEAVRFLYPALDPGIRPVGQMLDPFRIARRLVAVVKAVEKRADEPADLFAE